MEETDRTNQQSNMKYSFYSKKDIKNQQTRFEEYENKKEVKLYR